MLNIFHVDLEHEKLKLIAEINDAFTGVSRIGTISWAETIAQGWEQAELLQKSMQENDDFDDAAITERRLANAKQFRDIDTEWSDLIENPLWDLDPYSGGFSYLEPVGLRYYIPAAMTKVLLGADAHDISWVLTCKAFMNLPFQVVDWRSDFFQRWSVLDSQMAHCVMDFVKFQLYVSRLRLEAANYRLGNYLENKEIVDNLRRYHLGNWPAALESWDKLIKKTLLLEGH